MQTFRFDAFTYSGARHVMVADGDTGPIVMHTPHEARVLAGKLLAAADAVDGVPSRPLQPSERRRLASQARAVADSGADVQQMRSALQFWAAEVLAGVSAVAPEREMVS